MVLNKALFLDRDGVINIEKDYLYKIEDFEFIDDIFDVCKFFQNINYKIFVVTNQSGIARGYYSEQNFKSLSKWMKKQFLEKGINITAIYHCPHHPSISGECDCRKPKSGMLKDASLKYNIDLKNSVIIGDKERDIEAGINAGLISCYLFDEKNIIKDSKALKIIQKLGEIYVDFK